MRRIRRMTTDQIFFFLDYPIYKIKRSVVIRLIRLILYAIKTNPQLISTTYSHYYKKMSSYYRFSNYSIPVFFGKNVEIFLS